MSKTLPDAQVRIWIDACNSEEARETLRELLAYRIGGYAAPLKQRALEAVVTKLLDWAGKRCPCENDLPNPCPLCLADANNPADACKAVDETFPPNLVRDMRNALALAPSNIPDIQIKGAA